MPSSCLKADLALRCLCDALKQLAARRACAAEKSLRACCPQRSQDEICSNADVAVTFPVNSVLRPEEARPPSAALRCEAKLTRARAQRSRCCLLLALERPLRPKRLLRSSKVEHL